jgi:D-alanine--poly(phosphoribitol) ligase subunit 1
MAEGLLHTDESPAQRVAGTMQKFADNNAMYIGQRYYTYAELYELTKAVYSQIPQNKLYNRIGIYCNNDIYTYASILAVGLYGAAYVPLNANFPVLRNRKTVEDCGLELILSSLENTNFKEVTADVQYVLTGSAQNTASTGIVKKTGQETSYILFTSGSTGDPKGVPVSNSNLRSFFNYFLSGYDFNEKDRFLQTYELTFDVSVFSFFMPLLVGACCYVLPDEGVKPLKIAECLLKHNITVVSMVPGVLRYLDKYLKEISLPALRYSFFSGDALYHGLALKWSACIPNAAIHNFYGPTETTIVCTRHVFDSKKIPAQNGIVPLGKAFEGMEFIIVNEDHTLTEKGELCFSGTQVIPSYLNDENEEKFFVKDGKRYYKTGDIVSLNGERDLVFHGRSDSQVKVNGYRVELAEVENALRNVCGRECIVLCVEEDKLSRLIAYVEQEADVQALRNKLAELLPGYMIPQKIISVAAFPLNTNGKIDRKALINAYI